MTGILRRFKRKTRVTKEKDGWWVEKKYHGYFYQEIPIPFDTRKQAEEALRKLKLFDSDI